MAADISYSWKWLAWLVTVVRLKSHPSVGLVQFMLPSEFIKSNVCPRDVRLKNAQGMRTIIPRKQRPLDALSLHGCRIVHVCIVMHLIIETFPHLYWQVMWITSIMLFLGSWHLCGCHLTFPPHQNTVADEVRPLISVALPGGFNFTA